MIHHSLHQHLVEAPIALLIERGRIAQHPQRMALMTRLIGRVHVIMLVQAKTQRLVEAQPAQGDLVLWRIYLQDDRAPRRLAEGGKQA